MHTIPLALEEITPDWLSEVLAGPYPGSVVSAVELETAHVGTTGRALLRVTYEGGSELPTRLFVKLPPDDTAQRNFVAEVGMGRTEARFYRELADELGIAVPRCLYANFNAAGDRYIMLLENLQDRGCTFRNASVRYSLDYLRQVLDAFVSLHGQFWNSRRFAAGLDWIQPPVFHPMGPALVKRACDQLAAGMPAVFTDMASLYLDHTGDIHQLWNEGVPTLVHGDIHDGNMFYDPGWRGRGGPGFLDWGVMSRTSAMRDVAYFLAATPTPADRREHLSALLDYYFERLQERVEERLERDALMREFRWHTAYVWVGAVTTVAMGNQWQSLNYVTATLERLHLALEHSAGVAALREAIR